ncbi:hypothetical protein CASFOL_033346 [Castilleja foliolosa]|uniref:GRF-type domain-containing protein n=1 Tax=Castilleja foliolosa TaxID=1961234 RepID=A0ABD3BYZ6_9LAMI
MSTSSTSSGRMNSPKCKCKLDADLEISKTAKNPLRLFYGCPKYGSKSDSCDFFDWYDNAKYEQDRNELQKLIEENDALKSENESLHSKVHQMQIQYETLQQNMKDANGTTISWKVAIMLMLVTTYIAKLM